MSRTVWPSRIPLFALLFACWAMSGSLSPTFAYADAKGPQPIEVKNADPEFTLTLPPRYVAIKPTGDAIYAFGTADKTTAAVIAIYRLNRTVQRGTTDVSKFSLPDARRVDMSWQSLPLEVIAWHPAPDKGSKLTARWVEVPLQSQGISILAFVPLEKEALADEIMHDFLSGLAGPSNWAIERPLTAGERGMRLGLGLALFLVVLGAPVMAVRWLRRRLKQSKRAQAAAPPGFLRNFGAALAKPAFNKPGYLIRLAAFVVVIIAAGLGYIALTAAAVMLVFNQSLDASFNVVLFLFELACVIPLVILVGVLIRSRLNRGRILLDLGRDQVGMLFLAVGLLCLIAAFLGAAGAFMNSRSRLATVVLPVLQLAMASMFILRGIGRVQITEQGVWQNSSLLRWAQINSYRWTEDSTELVLQGPTPIPTKLAVPPAHKQAVQDLLVQHGLTQTTL